MNKSNIEFDSRVYDLETIQKAAYRFIDKLAINFVVDENKIVCEITIDDNESNPSDILQELKKEVLDQSLRKKIAKETESIRHLILAHTFSRTGLS